MKPHATFPLLLLALSVCDACASTTPRPAATSATRRRRRRAQPATPVAQPETAVAPAPASDASTARGFGPGLALAPAAPRASERRPDGGAMDARATTRSFGTPVVSASGERGDLHAVWSPSESRARIRCEGTAPSAVPSTQSPYEPGAAATVRSFLPVEPRVVACRPRTNERGRLPVRGLFTSNGAPAEYTFPGVALSRETAMCVGEALCAARMPAFRALNALVDYEVLVYVPTE